MSIVRLTVRRILNEIISRYVPGENKTLVEQLDELRDQLNEMGQISQSVDLIASDAHKTTSEGLMNIDEAEKVLDKIHGQLTVRIIVKRYYVIFIICNKNV